MADLVFPGAPTTVLNAGALPTSNDLVIYKGDYIELFVTVKDEGGTAISLAGATPEAQLKLDYEDTSPIDFDCTLPGPTGQVRIHMPSSVTSTLEVGSYIWDFQVTYASGDVRTYLAGDVTVYNEVTT